MRYKKINLIVILLLGFGLSGLKAQEAIPCAGGNGSGSGGSISFTVGQVVYASNTGITGSVAQGVQQPFEISVVTGIKDAANITLQCSVFPNPVTDFLILKVENYKTENLSYQIFTINGKLLETKKVESNETGIFMKDLVSATYFLKLIQTSSQQEIKTFKIIKLN